MIIWSGRGILSVVILVASVFLLLFIIPKEYSNEIFIFSFFITGAFCWFMGNKWNKKEGRTYIDKATGEEFMVKPNHSLFWIKMQYWGPIFAVLGLIIVFQEFMK